MTELHDSKPATIEPITQFIPSGEVITEFPESETATKRLLPKVTDCQEPMFAGGNLTVQVIPSGEVITELLPVFATATKRPLP